MWTPSTESRPGCTMCAHNNNNYYYLSVISLLRFVSRDVQCVPTYRKWIPIKSYAITHAEAHASHTQTLTHTHHHHDHIYTSSHSVKYTEWRRRAGRINIRVKNIKLCIYRKMLVFFMNPENSRRWRIARRSSVTIDTRLHKTLNYERLMK